MKTENKGDEDNAVNDKQWITIWTQQETRQWVKSREHWDQVLTYTEEFCISILNLVVTIWLKIKSLFSFMYDKCKLVLN